ncbi:omptin family outer membrane protease [Rhizobium leguminosarum]
MAQAKNVAELPSPRNLINSSKGPRMACEYFHPLTGSTHPALQRHGDTDPTPAAYASGTTQSRSEEKKLRPKTGAPNETLGELMKRVVTGFAITFCLLVATPSLAAANNALYSSDDGNFIVFGGMGLANIKAQEFVYNGDHKVSQLNWESKGMTLFTLGVDAQFDNDWSITSSVEIGTGGTGHMVDYDWMLPGHDDWSHRSIHPLTESLFHRSDPVGPDHL